MHKTVQRCGCFFDLQGVLSRCPDATAQLLGSSRYPDINGFVRFFNTYRGTLVAAEICGLPKPHDRCKKRIFAFHIHEGENCSGSADDPFSAAMSHYNPNGCQHPFHAGDLPPLFGNDGFALSVFLTDRFSVKEIIGKTLIIHSAVDDFTSQPAGNAGEKIACGKIRAI